MKKERIISLLILFSLLLVTVLFFTACKKDGDDVNAGDGTLPVEERLFTNKTQYFNGEEIYVTAYGKDNQTVGIYRANDDISNTDAIREYTIGRDGFVSGNTYAFKKSSKLNQSRQALKYLPNGKYKFVLFKDGGKEVEFSKNIEILVEKIQKPIAPSKVTYTLDNLQNGLADGDLKITLDKKSYAEEIVMYWANGNGKLDDYTALAPFFALNNDFTFEMYSNTIIPNNATKLWLYSKNSIGISDEYYEVVLPENCQFSQDTEAICEFQVVSDIHIAVDDTHCMTPDTKEVHKAHLLAMCDDILNISPNSSGIFVAGDIANSGRRYEWELADSLFKSFENLPDVYYSLGNHDLYGGESFNTLVQNFYDFAGVNSVYYEKNIGGYHHIFLGTESKKSGVDADLSDVQLAWFDSKMQELTSAEPNKPVFVYLHQSLYNTIAGSFPGQGWDGIIQDSQFKAIVEKYKQIVMFNGHSHWDMNTRGSMYSNGKNMPNIFNTASVGYLWTSFYLPAGEYLTGSQGYYVKVFKDKILVYGRDFTENKYIPSACFVAAI